MKVILVNGSPHKEGCTYTALTFLLLGRHSTNIWLVHMFFFSQLFPNLVFFAKFPVLVFVVMMVLCFAASMVVNALYQPILARLDRR